MKRHTNYELVVDRLVIVLGLLTLTLWGLGSQSAIAEDSPQVRCADNAQQIGSERVRPKESPGMRAYLDPVTGEFGVPPSWEEEALGTEALVAPGAPASTSDAGLVETPSPVPGGGVMVDLQGRFQSPLVATIGTDGKMTMRHLPCVQDSDDQGVRQ